MHAVLVYHTISVHPRPLESNIDISPKRFERHLQWLDKRRERITSLENLLNVPESERRIAITFDDGFKDNLTVALPLLEKYGFPMTIFVAANFIGLDDYLNEKELRELANHPLVTIGSHGMSHQHFPDLTEEEARFELVESKNILEKITGKKIDLLAWSFGDCNEKLEKMSKEAGYRAAWSVWNGNNTAHSRWRVPLGRNDNLVRFIAKCSPFYFPVKRRLKPPINH